jgi:hypothetical protein
VGTTLDIQYWMTTFHSEGEECTRLQTPLTLSLLSHSSHRLFMGLYNFPPTTLYQSSILHMHNLILLYTVTSPLSPIPTILHFLHTVKVIHTHTHSSHYKYTQPIYISPLPPHSIPLYGMLIFVFLPPLLYIYTHTISEISFLPNLVCWKDSSICKLSY